MVSHDIMVAILSENTEAVRGICVSEPRALVEQAHGVGSPRVWHAIVIIAVVLVISVARSARRE